MNDIIILDDLEYWSRFCEFHQTNGEFRLFEIHYNGTNYPKVNGHFFFNDIDFVALYSRNNKVKLFYQKEFDIHKGLTIKLVKNDYNHSTFIIEDYNVEIHYEKSKFIGLDCWSQEDDVDLFYIITESYKKDIFYEEFNKKYGQ